MGELVQEAQELASALARSPQDVPPRWLTANDQRSHQALQVLLAPELQPAPQVLGVLPHAGQGRSPGRSVTPNLSEPECRLSLMNTEKRRKAVERSRIISRVHAEWAAEQAGQFTPDPRYADDPAYAESPELISASPEAQAELLRRTTEALEAAGLASEKPVRHARSGQQGQEGCHDA